MATRTPSELARQAMTNGTALRIEFDLFRGDIKDLKLSELRERCVVLETQLVAIRKEADALPQLRQANAVLEDRVVKLEKRAEEADKRQGSSCTSSPARWPRSSSPSSSNWSSRG